ncbi:hypothetical protein [Planotetraspora phitsanulokensis]|uniref:hypothetical protein n=1 Tax=Planotetraspora phitsanulokensis TaxID=575192 RepID=UPI001EF2D627|nr:hypothetical protein [Planotetraspora phitsanulokensis]
MPAVLVPVPGLVAMASAGVILAGMGAMVVAAVGVAGAGMPRTGRRRVCYWPPANYCRSPICIGWPAPRR